jgi:glycosyltransferase involved in cell wall biosynthesis
MLFSILTTSYNQSKTIRQTIDSCLNQTFDDYEILISDDGSTDESFEIIKSISSPKIRYFRQDKNLKEYPNRNFLVENARGKYVIFIDAEDIIYPHALASFSYYLSIYPDIGMIVMRQWSRFMIYPVKFNSRDLYRFEFLFHEFSGGNFTNIVFNRCAIKRAGLFPTHIKSGDTYMQLKIASTEEAILISDGFTWWRKSLGNVTEKLSPEYSFKDYCHLANTNNYRIELLDDKNCPLEKNEIEIAKINIYGAILRTALRWILRGRFNKVYYLFQNIRVPSKYWITIFIRAKRDYFKNYSGDNPLHS